VATLEVPIHPHLQGIGMTSRRTRQRMVERLKKQGIKNTAVLEVMRHTPRHIFVDEALASRAYEETALPIGYNQTISRPYIVAKMTELLLEKKRPTNVLEIGTGCGYQTAILAQLVDWVYSIERILPLQKKALHHLTDLSVENVSYRHDDGALGWQEHAPFNGILVSAATDNIPQNLLQQLAVHGVMLIPIISEKGQFLQRITRLGIGYQIETLEPVSFVPFLSGLN
jgi:protein-L-isoaspartate(D-aspartate) O-methyltransferase